MNLKRAKALRRLAREEAKTLPAEPKFDPRGVPETVEVKPHNPLKPSKLSVNWHREKSQRGIYKRLKDIRA